MDVPFFSKRIDELKGSYGAANTSCHRESMRQELMSKDEQGPGTAMSKGVYI